MKRTPLKRKTPLRAKSQWRSSGSSLKTHKPMRRVGRVGRANSKARKMIGEHAAEMNLKRCEIGLPGCTETWPLAPAHRHKRAWYKGSAELLADPKQWVCACQVCHDQIEIDAALTEEIFMRLRGPEALPYPTDIAQNILGGGVSRV